MEKSENINELVTALVGFHKEVGKIIKNSKNPFFKSSYGDLNSYLAEIKEPLFNNGLAVIQLPITNGLTTLLTHTSGQFISSTMEMIPTKNTPQEQGSALTYMRRYSLASILNLNAEDDDGNAASTPQKTNVEPRESKKNPVRLDYTALANKCDTIESLKKWFNTLNDEQKKEASAVVKNKKKELSKISPIETINKISNESELKSMYEAILQEKDTIENYIDVANAFNKKADELNSELNLLPF